MQILAIANQKGGVSKTTTAAALGYNLARRFKVLLLDCDPQASLTQGLGVVPAAGASLAEVIGGAGRGTLPLKKILQPITENLDLAPSDITLANSELGLTQRMGRENVIKQALATVQGYDICIIDCPPSLGLLTVNALVAARGVIVPTIPAAADLRGVKMFLDTLESIKELNPALALLGVLVVQFDARLLAHNEAVETITAAGLRILGTIPRSVRVQEASAAKQSITSYDPGSKPAAAYTEFTNEVIQWLKATNPA